MLDCVLVPTSMICILSFNVLYNAECHQYTGPAAPIFRHWYPISPTLCSASGACQRRIRTRAHPETTDNCYVRVKSNISSQSCAHCLQVSPDDLQIVCIIFIISSFYLTLYYIVCCPVCVDTSRSYPSRSSVRDWGVKMPRGRSGGLCLWTEGYLTMKVLHIMAQNIHEVC
jgi:hypothetical protein